MLRLHISIAVCAAVGCVSRVAPQAPAPQASAAVEQRFGGRVSRVDGAPAVGAVIIVSDAVKGDELAVVRAGHDGRFSTTLAPGAYALTATDPEQFAYLPSADGTRDALEVRLTADCERVRGHLSTVSSVPQNAVVHLTRLSDFAGDRFGAAVAADGAFHACVPAATYFIEAPDGFASRDAYVVVPYPGVLEFRTDARRDTDRVVSDLSGITPESTEAFVAALPTATKVLGLAESNHGTREFYGERTTLALHLAKKQGFRLLMIEAGYGEVLALDDYINGAHVDAARAVQELGYWIWDTKDFLQTLGALRDYNARSLPDARIHIIGFDVQDTNGSIKYLQRNASTLLSVDERALLNKMAEQHVSWRALATAEQTRVRATLGRIAAMQGTGGATSKASRTVLAARSLLLTFNVLEKTKRLERLDARDAGMAQMVVDVITMEPGSRATLWAHLGHLGRDYAVGLWSMGARLGATLGDGYRVYGLFALGGSARAWDEKGEIGVIAHTLSAPPPFSLEGTLATQSHGARVTYWTFSRAKDEAARWLKQVHLLRHFGAAFVPAGQEFTYWDLQSFDGAILFDSVSPTEPTATGERRASPKKQSP